ncbi:MAG: helix-turn-helix transcriptional regulator [Propionibacteriaceae bacterium]|nr:helix-turn-helix transcriptional regulator [Propionibacteriaceae bacterium]
MDVDKQLLKGTIPLLVLHLLTQADMYGYQLIKSLEQISAGIFRFSEGTLYPVLHSLERDGLLRAYWRVSDVGRKRKYYAITDRGRRELGHRTAEWQTFTGAVNAVLAEEIPHD